MVSLFSLIYYHICSIFVICLSVCVSLSLVKTPCCPFIFDIRIYQAWFAQKEFRHCFPTSVNCLVFFSVQTFDTERSEWLFSKFPNKTYHLSCIFSAQPHWCTSFLKHYSLVRTYQKTDGNNKKRIYATAEIYIVIMANTNIELPKGSRSVCTTHSLHITRIERWNQFGDAICVSSGGRSACGNIVRSCGWSGLTPNSFNALD